MTNDLGEQNLLLQLQLTWLERVLSQSFLKEMASL